MSFNSRSDLNLQFPPSTFACSFSGRFISVKKKIVLNKSNFLSWRNIYQGHKTRPNIFISLVDHADEASSANIKIERQRWLAKSLMSERSETQYVVIETKVVWSYSGAHLVESCCKESSISDTIWLRHLFFIIVDQNSVEFKTSSVG